MKWCASLGFVQPRTRNTPRLRESLFVSKEFCICIQSNHYLYPNYSLFVSGEFFLCVQSTHYLYPGNYLLYSPHMMTDETTFVRDSAPFLVVGVYSGFTSERSPSYKILLMYKNHRFGKWKNIAYKFVHFFVSTKCMIVFRCRLGCSTCPTDLDLLF